MARRTPGLVQMITTTTGNGPYFLANPSPALTGKRTIADAVADSSLANGDQIIYCIKDTTALPTGKLMEVGIGTINTTTLVLTVVNVIERSAALASGGGWGSGQRDVIISPPVASITAFTDFQNVFTVAQFIKATYLEFHVTPGNNDWIRIERTGIVGSIAMASEKVAKEALQIQNGWLGSGTAAGETLIDFYVGEYTALIRALRIRESGALEAFSSLQLGGVLTGVTTITDNTSRKAVFYPTGGVVKQPFNSAPPTGWTRINTVGDVLFKFATAAEAPGATGGAWPISGLTADGHALVDSELSSHNHGVGDVALAASGVDISVITPGGGFFQSTTTVGADEPHTHPISSNGLWRPPYKVVVEASFD